jgi:hypothetical protein
MMSARNSVLLILSSLITFSCVSTERENGSSDIVLNRVISSLHNSCRMGPKNGFSADVLFHRTGGMRIEGVWDVAGHLNGQVLNPVGEDLLNFRIDSSGIIQTDSATPPDDAALHALNFLAQLGAQRTRLLLCSGLFLNETPSLTSNKYKITPENNYEIQTSEKSLHLESRLKKSPNDEKKFIIITRATSGAFFFTRTIANIEWIGAVGDNSIHPRILKIITPQTEITLSFLDYE